MRNESARRRSTGGLIWALVVTLCAAVMVPVAASAAPGDLAHGVVVADANQNNTIDAVGAAGTVDQGVGGVSVALAWTNAPVDDHPGWSTTTGADGSWSFVEADVLASIAADYPEFVGTPEFRVVIDVEGVNNNAYATSTASGGDNDFTRAGGNQTSLSLPFSSDDAPKELTALVFPAWELSLNLLADSEGFGGKSVYTGTGPFDAVAGVGNDTSKSDDVVRTGDLVTYEWALSLSQTEPVGSSVAKNVVFEQTIHLADSANVNFNNFPSIASGSGEPTNKIVAYGLGFPGGIEIDPRTPVPDGTTHVTLTANLGEQDAGLVEFPTSVWVANTSGNTDFTTSSRVYAVDANGAATAQPSDSVDLDDPINITSAPRYDLAKSPWRDQTFATREINGAQVAGYHIYTNATIAAERKVGVEALADEFTFKDLVWAENGGDVVPDFEYYITNVQRNNNGNTNSWVLGGLTTGNGASLPHQSVSDSGTPTWVRDDPADYTSPYTVTVSGTDTSGAHYPTNRLGGGSLAAGPFYVASFQIQVFVPLRAIDKAEGEPDDGIGEIALYNVIGNFDPDGVNGNSNYGDGVEPDWRDIADGPVDPSTVPSDLDRYQQNFTGPATVFISPGDWSKSTRLLHQAWTSGNSYAPGLSSWHGGDAQLQPGSTVATNIELVNSSAATWEGIGLGDVFDRTTAKIIPLKDHVANGGDTLPDDVYAQVIYSQPGVAQTQANQEPIQERFTIQYGVFDPDMDNANTGQYHALSSRFAGDWSVQRSMKLEGDARITWYDSVADVPGGADAVNAVRAIADEDFELAPGERLILRVAFEQRNTYNGGPNAGQEIPAGTQVVNFASVKTSSYSADWSGRVYDGLTYNEETETFTGESGRTDGDRWTVQRATAALVKRTISVDGVGVETAVGATAAIPAGDPIIWQVEPTLSAESDDPAPVRDVTITDTLQSWATYNEAMTIEIGGTPASSYTLNGDGTTTLVWNLGTLTPNEPIAPRIIYTDTDSLAPNGTTVTNTATITGYGLTPQRVHTDDHSITLEQIGGLQLRKDVEQTLYTQDQEQTYTLNVKSFSENARIPEPTIYEVLPYNGDATSTNGPNRTPASSFDGTSGLLDAPAVTDFGGSAEFPGTLYYTTVAPASVPQNINDDNDASIWSTTLPDDPGTVTGFRFVADEPLAVVSDGDKSGIKITFTTDQVGNSSGDLYANRFTAFSTRYVNQGETLRTLSSNQTTVRVIGFSLGDLIWFDLDGDGVFTDADETAPEGVKVEVYHDVDGTVTKIADATTNADGRWLVNDLPEGSYFAVIPASEFAAGGPLHGYEPATAGFHADPNTDLNEGEDHHAISDADRAGAVRSSGLITLSATVDGSAITGDEPLGDNVGGLVPSPLTTDDFTNFTLDLALAPAPGYEFNKISDPVSGTAVNPGDTITYTLFGSNFGKTVLDPVVITDDLAEVLAYSTLDGDPVAYIVEGENEVESDAQPVLDGTELTWEGVLEVGQQVKIVYAVTVNEGTEGETLNNVASSSATPPGLPPITPPDVSTEHPVPGYTLEKVSDPGTGSEVEVGSAITYTVTGTNIGATVLDPVVITDDLSKVLDNATLSGTPSAVIIDVEGTETAADAPVIEGTTLTWTGALEVGQKVVVTYTVKVNDDAYEKTLVNVVTSTATPPGGTPLTPPPGTTTHETPGKPVVPTTPPTSPPTGANVIPVGIAAVLLLITGTGLAVLAARRKGSLNRG